MIWFIKIIQADRYENNDFEQYIIIIRLSKKNSEKSQINENIE